MGHTEPRLREWLKSGAGVQDTECENTECNQLPSTDSSAGARNSKTLNNKEAIVGFGRKDWVEEMFRDRGQHPVHIRNP